MLGAVVSSQITSSNPLSLFRHIALIGGEGFEMADDWAALLACGIITINGMLILKGALHDVLDGKVSGDIHSEIAGYAHSVVGVRAGYKDAPFFILSSTTFGNSSGRSRVGVLSGMGATGGAVDGIAGPQLRWRPRHCVIAA
jgi:hypothetical protein